MAVVAFPRHLPALKAPSSDDEDDDRSLSRSFQNRVMNSPPAQRPMPQQSMDDNANEKDGGDDCDASTISSMPTGAANDADEMDAAFDECLLLDDATTSTSTVTDNDPVTAQLLVDEDEQATLAADMVETVCTGTSADTTLSTDRIIAPSSYGGLDNLGNTCYLNSALQMLASLDHFMPLLKTEQPATVEDETIMEVDQTDDSSSNSDKQQIRAVFLGLMDALSKGETVVPDRFKAHIDERTPLFVGYHQQDSHEFLTTLLDLIDEDYKVEEKKPETVSEEEKECAGKSAGDPMQEENVSTAEEKKGDMESCAFIGLLLPATTEPSASLQVQQTLEEDRDQSSCHLEETPAKKLPTLDMVDASSAVVLSPGLTQASRCQSFSELRFEGIEELLHGTSAARNTNAPSTPVGPRCKLVGGRMTAPDPSALIGYDTSAINAPATAMVCENDNSSDDASISSSQTSTPTKVSPVESNFTCEVRVRLTCCSCKYTRFHNETFLHLSLEIAPDSGCVADGLRRFFSEEKREIKCEKCFYEYALQTTEITKLPRALLLHFKRFIVDVSPDYSSITYRKNQSEVSFDSKLELQEEKGGVLSEFFAPDVSFPEPLDSSAAAAIDEPCYRIRSVVNHIGSSASCGHYTADANRLYPDGQREWTRFNDSFVSRISQQEAVDDASRTAYMVMYELS